MIEIQHQQKKVNDDQVIAQQVAEWLRDGRLILSPEFKQPMAGGKLAVGRVEAAELLSVSIRTFDRWVASGLIIPGGVGRRKIFAVTELQRFLKETSEVINV